MKKVLAILAFVTTLGIAPFILGGGGIGLYAQEAEIRCINTPEYWENYGRSLYGPNLEVLPDVFTDRELLVKVKNKVKEGMNLTQEAVKRLSETVYLIVHVLHEATPDGRNLAVIIGFDAENCSTLTLTALEGTIRNFLGLPEISGT